MARTFESHNKIGQIFSENIDDLIFILNDKNRCEYVNFQAFTEKKKIYDFIHPEDLKRVIKIIKDIFRLGHGMGEAQIKYENKPFRWFEIKGKSFIDSEDNAKKVFLICRDITKFKKFEFDLNKSHARFDDLADSLPEIQFWKLLQTREGKTVVQKTREMLELIFDNIPQLIYWKDTNLVYMGCNKNFALLNKIKEPTSIIGRTDKDLIWLKDNVKFIQDRETEVMRNDNPEYNAIESLITLEGKQTWFEINRIPLHDSKGNVVGILVTYEDITIRKIAEQKLKESEKKYRHLFESSPYSIILVDRNGKIIDANPVTEKIFGRTIDDLINKSFLDVRIKPENVLPLFKQRYTDILEGKVPDPIEVQVSRSTDNRKVWINIDDSLVEIGDETVFQVIIQDITEKKIAEQELKKSQEELKILNIELEQKVLERSKDLIESEQQYRTTIDSLNDLLHVVDKDLTIILVNKELKRWLVDLNINADILGRKISEAFPFLPPKIYEEYKQVFESGMPLITMETTILPDIDVITETRKIPIFSEGNVNQIITIIRDITESKKMENQLKESEENFRNMITNLDEGYYKIEMDGKIIYHNPAFSKIAGYDFNENLIGKQQPFYWRTPEDRDNYIGELLKKGFIRNYIVHVKKKIGEEIVVQVNAHLIRDDNNKPTAIEGTFSDITEKFRLEQELLESEKKLRQQNIELKKLDKVKNDFITMAAHELKTPLISISGYTDYILMKHRSQLNLEITQDLLTVQRNVNRLEVLMDQLLDVLKIDENELKLQKELVNVSKIINDCLDELSYLINEKNLEIILNIEHEIMLDVDSTRIFSVFTNLLSNAIKFTPDYGWIEISAKEEDNKYVFEVRDNGIGLVEDEIGRLFKKFERIKPPIINEHLNIQDSGTGLGLYITKGIITAHGGKIWASSEGENKGSTFSFTLPI